VSDTNTSVVTYSPTLVVDANATAAANLARQLSNRGFAADVAITCLAAKAAAHARHYRALVFAADLSLGTDLMCLASLRNKLPRTWIIVISANEPHDAQCAILRHCADAVLSRPLSIEDLVFRLEAFSHRSRPP
jgi:two-component system, OmpR family, response regulator